MPIDVTFETHETLSIPVHNELSQLGLLAEKLDEFGLRNNVSANVVYHFGLILDEPLTNIISYGYAESDDDHDIRVGVLVADGTMTVQIEDDAEAFDPLTAPPPDIDAGIEERPIGGLGVHFVKTFMDSVAYEYRDGRNHLTISKAF